MNFLTKQKTTLAVILLMAVVIFSSLTHKAYAQGVPVDDFLAESELADIAVDTTIIAAADVELNLKETILDGIAYALINVLISTLSQSLVTWINSGFRGSPGFISNPGNFFLNVANTASGLVIDDLDANFLCQPFRFNFNFQLGLNLGLGTRTPHPTSVSCTLNGILNNVTNFTNFTKGDFAAGGGLSGLLSVSQPENNPVGAFIFASAEVDAAGAREKELAKVQADWGRGFKSVTDTVTGAIKTPGVVVENQLNNALDSGERRIEAADEINEIVGALLGQLLGTVTGGLGGGTYSANADTITSYPTGSVPPTLIQNQCPPPGTPGLVITNPNTGAGTYNGVPCQGIAVITCPAGTLVNSSGQGVDAQGNLLMPPCQGAIPSAPPPSGGGSNPNQNTSDVINLRGLAQASQSCTAANTAGVTYTANNAIDGTTLTISGAAQCSPAGMWQMTLSQPKLMNRLVVIAPASTSALPAGTTITFYSGSTLVYILNPAVTATSQVNIDVLIPPVTADGMKIDTHGADLWLAEVQLFQPVPPQITFSGTTNVTQGSSIFGPTIGLQLTDKLGTIYPVVAPPNPPATIIGNAYYTTNHNISVAATDSSGAPIPGNTFPNIPGTYIVKYTATDSVQGATGPAITRVFNVQ